MSQLNWRTSSYSNNGQGCVGVAWGSGMTHIRDSKKPDEPGFEVSHEGWSAFLGAFVRPRS